MEKKSFSGIRRRPLTISQTGLVGAELREGIQTLPLTMQPLVEGVDLPAWARANREQIEQSLLKYGGVHFRDFQISSPEAFEQVVAACSTEILSYKERSSPRTQIRNQIYTSTDYPADQSIFLHNENSYQHIWPMKIFFFGLLPAQQGGETPIADCRRVLERLDPKIKQRFIEKGWMLTRNFGEGLSLPWQAVFQTEEKSAVEEYCRSAGIEFEWRGERLRTRQARRAVTRHPATGEMIWFNHAAFFHISTLERSTQEALLAGGGEDELPSNSYYGDGSPIENAVLEEIREAYRSETVDFAWRKGDILMLDNMLVAHGRKPYIGQRTILAAMADPFGTSVTTYCEEGNARCNRKL
jgi:alpha-ketoglutarate-dependent taurine dioxygenase